MLRAVPTATDDIGVELLITTKTKTPRVQRERVVRGDVDEADLVATALSVSRAVQASVDHPIRGWPCRGCAYSTVCS